MSSIKVKKRDQGLEDWNFDKLVASISRVMKPIDQAVALARKIEIWATEKFDKGELVLSTEIGDKIVEELSKIDPTAAENYKVYKRAS